METITVNLYEFDELNEEAKEKARDWYRDANSSESFYLDEIYDSLKAVFKTANIKLTDWSLGAYNRGNDVSFDLGDAGELKGKRAMAWLENNLLAKCRITAEQFSKNRKNYMSFGDSFRIGKIKPGPFTGMCYDEDYIDALKKSIASGDTLKEAFKNLANICGTLCENEVEYQNEDETVDENIRANEYTFTKSGKREG